PAIVGARSVDADVAVVAALAAASAVGGVGLDVDAGAAAVGLRLLAGDGEVDRGVIDGGAAAGRDPERKEEDHPRAVTHPAIIHSFRGMAQTVSVVLCAFGDPLLEG